MLNLETALTILNKYGYNSTSVHPYIYQDKDEIGICYSFVDQKYGMLERIITFDSENSLEDFIKKFQWYKVNGNTNNVTMSLDDYEIEKPKIIYKRNNRVMAEDEMFDLKKYDDLIKFQEQSTEANKYLKVVSEILNLYDEKKDKIEIFFTKGNTMQENIQSKYMYLQSLVDKYNKSDISRADEVLPIDRFNSGINIEMENVVKDKNNQYKSNPPEVSAANELIVEAAELLKSVELNDKYFQLLPIEFTLQQELDLIQSKIDFLEDKISHKRKFFSWVVNLNHKFKKIEKKYNKHKPVFNEAIVTGLKDMLSKKYLALGNVSYLNYSSYLLSAENYNGEDFNALAANFSTEESVPVMTTLKEVSYEDSLCLLAAQFEKLDNKDKNALVLLNTRYYKLIKTIMGIKDYATLPIDELISFLKITDGFAAIKLECYDNIKPLLEDYSNILYRNTVFNEVSFDSLEEFIKSMIRIIDTLKNINLITNNYLKVCFETIKYDELQNEGLIYLTNNVNSLVSGVKQKDNKIVLTKIMEGSPVLYSPKTLVIPDPDAPNKLLSYKETTNLDLIVDLSRLTLEKQEQLTTVSRYYSEIVKNETNSIVTSLNLVNKNIFADIKLRKG